MAQFQIGNSAPLNLTAIIMSNFLTKKIDNDYFFIPTSLSDKIKLLSKLILGPPVIENQIYSLPH